MGSSCAQEESLSEHADEAGIRPKRDVFARGMHCGPACPGPQVNEQTGGDLADVLGQKNAQADTAGK